MSIAGKSARNFSVFRSPLRCPSPSARIGFTLVELLIVIGIIALLIAILLPSLSRARAQARQLKCLSNQHQIGIALQLYTAENKGWYPCHSYWSNCFGKKGTLTYYDDPQFTGFAGEAGIIGERPLNQYLQTPEVCSCPDDLGDPFMPNVTSCFEAYGTSYLLAWGTECFVVQHVTGLDSDNPLRVPMKVGARGDMSIKIVLGDWPWHPNRPLTSAQTRWHFPNDKRRRMNMLFADGHAQVFDFPASHDEAPVKDSYIWEPEHPDFGVPPDPSRGYW